MDSCFCAIQVAEFRLYSQTLVFVPNKWRNSGYIHGLLFLCQTSGGIQAIFMHVMLVGLRGGGAVGVVMGGGAQRNVRARIAAVQKARQAAAQQNEEEGMSQGVSRLSM